MTRARKLALSQHESGLQIPLTLNPTYYIQGTAPFELWMFLAIVADDAGQRYVLQQRMVRLRISTETAQGTSDWEFNDVLALDFALDRVADGRHVAQRLVQRAALGLAGAEANSVDGSKGRVWVGAFSAESMNASTAQSPTLANCEQEFSIKAPQLQLQFSQRTCAQIDNTKTFAYAQSPAMVVNGTYVAEGGNSRVNGHGWMIHGWGLPPDNSASAVLFDRAWLVLDDKIDMQLQRSRRRSGRGPETTTGSTRLLDAQTDRMPLASAIFEDLYSDADSMSDKNTMSKTSTQSRINKDAPQGSTGPLAWRLVVTEKQLNVNINLALNAETSNDTQQQIYLYPVLIEGSHTGYGFVNLGDQ